MKLLLRITIVLVVLAAGLFWFSTTLPREIKIKQRVLIKASPDQVFPYLNNPTDWKNWSVWNKTYDPSMIYMYGGPQRGLGARQSWSGDVIGNWQMIFTQSVEPDSLSYELTQEGSPFKTKGNFILQKSAGGTLVTWLQTTPLEDRPLAVYKGKWLQSKKEEELQQSLVNLQALLTATTKTSASKR
jgi:uncharacterized protein YndB with AHSA1/START domain